MFIEFRFTVSFDVFISSSLSLDTLLLYCICQNLCDLIKYTVTQNINYPLKEKKHNIDMKQTKNAVVF